MATHSSILAWRIPWTEEPGRLQSLVLQRVGHNWATNTFFHAFWYMSSYECHLASFETHWNFEVASFEFKLQRRTKIYIPTNSVKVFLFSTPSPALFVDFYLFIFNWRIIALPNFVVAVQYVSDSVTPWTVARQAPLSVGFSRQESWSGLPCPSPGDLPDSGIEPTCIAGGFLMTEPPVQR